MLIFKQNKNFKTKIFAYQEQRNVKNKNEESVNVVKMFMLPRQKSDIQQLFCIPVSPALPPPLPSNLDPCVKGDFICWQSVKNFDKCVLIVKRRRCKTIHDNNNSNSGNNNSNSSYNNSNSSNNNSNISNNNSNSSNNSSSNKSINNNSNGNNNNDCDFLSQKCFTRKLFSDKLPSR